jgi:hypothetical protein
MTSVSGHLTSLDFADRYRKWETTPPSQLFEAETIIKIDPVSSNKRTLTKLCADESRSANQSLITFRNKRATPRCYLFGLIVTEKGSISALKYANRRERVMPESQSSEPDSATRSARMSDISLLEATY